jgi:hypothetical protein
VKTSPHEEHRELQGKLPLAQLHHPNSGMSDDVAGLRRLSDGYSYQQVEEALDEGAGLQSWLRCASGGVHHCERAH